jgi:hypothetical protein
MMAMDFFMGGEEVLNVEHRSSDVEHGSEELRAGEAGEENARGLTQRLMAAREC